MVRDGRSGEEGIAGCKRRGVGGGSYRGGVGCLGEWGGCGWAGHCWEVVLCWMGLFAESLYSYCRCSSLMSELLCLYRFIACRGAIAGAMVVITPGGDGPFSHTTGANGAGMAI